MLKNYFVVALRTLRRRPGTTAITLAGLALGVAAVVLMLLYAQHELTYDRFHTDADRTYLVYKERLTPTGTQVTYDTWLPLRDALTETFPGVELGVRTWTSSEWVARDDASFQERVTYADAAFFELFGFELTQGDPATALARPEGLVLSPEIAEKYFGREDPMGQTLLLDNAQIHTVTGILSEQPSNTVIGVDLLVPIASDPDGEESADSWNFSFLDTYVRLAEGTTAETLEAQFPAFVEDIWDAEVAARTEFKLEPLPDLYDTLTGNRIYALILLAAALAIILIAGINFTTLTIGHGVERAQEIGVRKAVGASRAGVIGQLWGEALLVATMGMGLGVALAAALLPFVNDLLGVRLALGLFEHPERLAALLGLGLLIGGLAGAYPAIVLARFKPAQVLRGRFVSSPGGLRLRHALVVVQFTLSIILMAGALVIAEQLNYLKTHDLGVDREQVLTIPVRPSDFADAEAAAVRLATFKQEVAALSAVEAVASSADVPGDGFDGFTFAWPEGTPEDQPERLRYTAVDAHFAPTYGIELVEGRNFLADSETDADEALILNEAAMRAFGWTSALGKIVRTGGRDREVIGVMRDYNYESLVAGVEPVVHFYRPPERGVHRHVSVRLDTDTVPAVVEQIGALWAELAPGRAFEYAFVDDRFAELYEAQDRVRTLAGAFTVLALVIACLGLFGLAALATRQRTKEIGVRKVLGATVPDLVTRLSRGFVGLVLVAALVALPLAWWGMNRWLDGFAYRIDLGAGPFVLALGLALGVALLAISLHTVRAATADPIRALRHE